MRHRQLNELHPNHHQNTSWLFFRRAQTQVTTVTIWLLSQMIKHNNCQQSTLHSKGPQTRLSIIKMPTHEDQIYKVNI